MRLLAQEIIWILRWGITGVTTIYFAYEIVIALFGFLRMKKPKTLIEKNHSFAVVISARDEENVIGYLIDSLKAQDYDKSLYDIFVIADNCTDNTATFARAKGAIAFERCNESKMSKGYALAWMFDILFKDYPDKYDAVCVFDADNIVEKNYLKEMNKQLCSGVEIAQGYRDIKNPSDTWISSNYSLYFWTNIRFYQIARYNVGLSCMIGGTGFMCKSTILQQDGGWKTNTICEDVEFSLYQVALGRKIGFAYDARFYDEQPLTFRQSWRQRMRWTAGNVMCIAQCMPGLLKSKSHKFFQLFDSAMFLLAIPCIIAGVLSTGLDILGRLLNIHQLLESFPAIIAFAALSYIITLAQGFVVVLMEKKPLKIVYKGLISYPIFMLSWAIVSVWGTIKQDTRWKPIVHSKAVGIEQIKQ